ncbi:hypothetical protein ACTFIU_001670 [Dictyostelium citrinum]
MIIKILKPKFTTTLLLLIVLILVKENVVFSQQQPPQYTCSEMEEPIVGDWGFSIIANPLPSISSTSPWKASNSVSFCTDDICGSSAYSLAGYYYAQFLYNESDPNTQISTLWQTVNLPTVSENEQYYLEYFLSSQFETNINPVLNVFVDGKPVASYNGNLLLGDLERVPLETALTQTLNVTFTTSYTNNGGSGGGGGGSSQSGFRIGSVIIRKPTNTILQEVYVDVANGSDKYGNGTSIAPFSTIQQALNSVVENGTIYLADGTYCNLASYLPISHSINILSQSGDPTKCILSGEYQLNLFKISYSNQPQDSFLKSPFSPSSSSSLLSTTRRGRYRQMESFFDISSNLITSSTSSSSSSSSSSFSDSGSNSGSDSSSSSSSSSPDSKGININVKGITVGYAYSSDNSPGGAALFIEGNVVASFSDCIFTSNADSQNRGSISARGNAALILENTLVKNCSCSKVASYGPAISMLGFGGSPTISLVNCTMTENLYNILVDETSDFNMQYSNIEGIAPIDGASLCSIMLSRTQSSTINNCNIVGINNGALCIINSISNISNTNFQGNNLKSGPGGNIYISQGSGVIIQNVVIEDSSGNIGAAIFAMELSKVNILNTVIRNIGITNSLISSSDSDLVLSQSSIYNTSNDYTIYLFFGTFKLFDSNITDSKGSFYATQTIINITSTLFDEISVGSHVFQDCQVEIIGSTFSNLNGFFYSSFSKIHIIGSLIEKSITQFLMISPLSNVLIENSIFSSNTDTIINLLSQSNLTVINSKFIDNFSNTSTNSILTQYEGSTSTFKNVLFENNRSPGILGGCIFTFSSVVLDNCTAIGNFAKQGGVISTTITGSLITIDGGSYINNSASGGGGVIFYSSIPGPTILNNATFSGNTASYGNNTATDAALIDVEDPFPTTFRSGQDTYSGRIYIKDEEGQIVSGFEVKIFLQISGNTIDSTSTFNGIAIFSNTTLYGPINTTVDVEFLSNNPNLPVSQTTSNVLKCSPGQIPSTTKIECTECRTGSYGYNGETCVQCPSIHAYCPGGAKVNQFEGWWYDINQTDKPYVLYECPNVNCIGSNTSDMCAPHSFGPLCAQCDPGYYDWGEGCKRCDKTSPILFIAIVVVSIGMIILVQSSDSESGLMTVIIYFAQTLMVLSTGVKFNFLALLNLEFQPGGSSSIFGICPGPFDYYQQHYFTLLSAPWLIGVLLISTAIFYIVYRYKLIQKLKNKIIKEQEENEKSKSISNYSSIVITSDPGTINNSSLQKSLERKSLLRKQQPLENDDDDSSNTVTTNDGGDLSRDGYTTIADGKHSILGKSIETSISGSLGSQVTLIDNATATPSNQTFLSQQLGAFIKLMLNIYTPIGKATFELFFCENVGVSAYVLIANNGVSCFTEQYHKALMVSYCLLIVIIGFPLILMILLFLNRKSLDDPHTQRTYGVFILKYKSSFYFWDVILLLRRLLIILMSTMDPTSAARSFLLVVVSLVSVLLQLKYQPFKRISDNRLELTSLSLLFICCVYLDNTVYQSIEQWIVISSSIIFFLHAVYILYSNYRYQIIDSLQHYLYIISRGKKGRKNSNNTLFGSNSYFLYNQDHIYNDDDFSRDSGIFSKKDKKQSKTDKNVKKSKTNNNNNNINNNNENNNENNNGNNNEDNNKVKEIEKILDEESKTNFEELNNNYYDSDDYDEDESSDDEEDDENNDESTNLLRP